MMENTGKAKKNKELLLIFFVILILGLFLRLYGITRESLWIDEGFSIGAARDIFKVMKSPTPIDFINNYVDKNPPLYFIFLNLWMKLFGTSEFAVRFPSVIIGLMSIFMIYKLAELLFNKEAGLFASFFLAVTYIHVYYSQETRYYNLFVLLAIVSFYFLEKFFDKGEIKYAAGYMIFTAMLLYTHVHSIFLVLTQNVYFILLFIFSEEFRKKTGYVKWLAIQFILGLLYLPWVRILLIQISDMQKGGWLRVPNHYQLVNLFYLYAGSFIILILFIMLIPLAIMKYSCEKGEFNWKNPFESIDGYSFNVEIFNSRKVLLPVLWLLIPIFLPYIYSRIRMPIFHFRYVIPASIPLYLLAAAGFSHLKSRGLKNIIVVIIFIISIFNLFTYSDLVRDTARERWRETVSYVENDARQGDLVVVSAGYCLDYIYNYYSKRKDIVKKPFPAYSASPRASRDTIIIQDKDIGEFRELTKDSPRVWIVMSHSYDPNNFMIRILGETHNMVFHKTFSSAPKSPVGLKIEVYLFEKR